MKRACRAAAILLTLPPFLTLAGAATESEFPALTAGPHPVGYRVAHLRDPSRSFGPRTDLQGKRLAGPLTRPVQVHLWYPAAPAGRAPLVYGDYIRASAAEDPEGALAAYRAAPLRRGVSAEKLDALLARPTHAVRDAAAAPGRFPLILYAPSINSDPFENALLFEFLAGHGYVIASCPSVGQDEPAVSLDFDGAAAELGDLMFVLGQVWNEPFIDQDRLGALGFSWGGTTVLLLALRHAGVDAVASLDGGHGFPAFRQIPESFPWWQPRRLRAAFLHAATTLEEKDLGFAAAAKYADTYRWRIPGLLHRDFAADGILRFRQAKGDPDFPVAAAAYEELGRRLKLFFDAYLKGQDTAHRALVAENPAGKEETWIIRKALPPVPTPAQFDELIETAGVEAAVARFRALRAADPDLIIFDEQRLLKYAVAWGPERSADLLKLLSLNLEAYPRSADTFFWLANIHLAQEDPGEAKQALESALALNPRHERARRLLEKIDPPPPASSQ